MEHIISPTVINSIPPQTINNIKELILSHKCKWTYSDYVVYNDSSGPFFQFIHHIHERQQIVSNLYYGVRPLLNYVEKELGVSVKDIIRIKANLTTQTPYNLSDLSMLTHQDIENYPEDAKFLSCLYYVDDSDGNTVFFEDDKTTVLFELKPTAGQMVVFDSKQWHRSTPPSFHKRRTIVSFVFLIN